MVFVIRRAPSTPHARRAVLFAALVLVQAAIGIVTLLMVVPIDVALTHQGVALVVLFFACAHWRATKGPYPLPGAPRRQRDEDEVYAAI